MNAEHIQAVIFYKWWKRHLTLLLIHNRIAMNDFWISEEMEPLSSLVLSIFIMYHILSFHGL